MKRIVIFVLSAVLLVGGGIALVKKKQGEIARLAKPQTPPPAVEVARVAEGDLAVTLHYLGTIVPFTRSDISSRISGNILTIAKREGDAVRQGEALVTIDDRELVDGRGCLRGEPERSCHEHRRVQDAGGLRPHRRTFRRGDFQALERSGRPRSAGETASDDRETIYAQ